MKNRRIVLVLCAVAALAALWLWASRQQVATAPAPAPLPAAALTPAEIPPLPEQPRIEAGGTLWIDSRKLDRSKPLTVDLALPEPPRSEGPLAVRFLIENAAPHLGAGLVSTDRTSARFEIDPAWLIPGRYVVEVKTTEQSHFPLRRYAIEVR